MIFDKEVPLRFWLNRGVDETRRVRTEAMLEDVGLKGERFPVFPADRRKSPQQGGGMPDVPADDSNKAYLLGQMLAIREAARRGAPAVLLMGDHCQIHPNFKTLLGTIQLPDDWGVLHLGMVHSEVPRWVGARVVEVGCGNHGPAVIVRASHYRKMMRILSRHAKAGKDDQRWRSDPETPIYACYPNMAWYDESVVEHHDSDGARFTRDGKQTSGLDAVRNLLPSLIGMDDHPPECGGANAARVKLGLLFLTRGDVNHPEIWREFISEAPDQVRIYAHAKDPALLAGGFLDGRAIDDHHETAWGDISLVRATRSLLLAALEDESITHFALLSESCVPIRPLPDILRHFARDPRSQFGFSRVHESSPRQMDRVKAVPGIPDGCWRFQSQWWIMNREAATFAAGQDFTKFFEKMIVPDEAYFATVLAMQGFPLEGEVVRKIATWTKWEKNAGSPRGWSGFPRERVQEAMHSGAVFARKFLNDSDIGSYRLHRTGS